MKSTTSVDFLLPSDWFLKAFLLSLDAQDILQSSEDI